MDRPMERKRWPSGEAEWHAVRWHCRGSLLALLAAVMTAACGGGDSAAAANPLDGAAPSPAPSYSTTVTWTAPTLNTDGSALTDIAGYRVLYGTSPANLS